MHHHVTNWTFEPKKIGAGYQGQETYQESAETIATSDGQVQIGAWRYDGRLQSSLTMQAHQTWVVIAGRAEIEIAGETMHLRAGSTVCFEAPYGPKIVEASDGFTAVWIAVPKR